MSRDGNSNIKHVLDYWQDHIRHTMLEKSKVLANNIVEKHIIHLDSHENKKNEEGIKIELNENQIKSLKNCFSSENKTNQNVYLMFPLIKVIEKEKGKNVQKLIPLFIFNISSHLESSACSSITLPVNLANQILALKNVFHSYLETDLSEFGENLHFIELIRQITGNKLVNSSNIFGILKTWVTQEISKKNYVRFNDSFDAYIGEFDSFDYVLERELNDYSHLSKSKIIDYPLLTEYISKAPNNSKYFRPVIGLFEKTYPLGQGQMEAIMQVGKDRKLNAVQGAPGTGKTTLFKSLIANLLTSKALSIIDGSHKKNNILISSTAKKAIENVINDLRTDELTTQLNWLYFQCGSYEQTNIETKRVDAFVANLKNEEFNEGRQEYLKEKIVHIRDLIISEYQQFVALYNAKKTALRNAGCSTFTEINAKYKESHLRSMETCASLQVTIRDDAEPSEIKEIIHQTISQMKDKKKNIQGFKRQLKKWQTFCPVFMDQKLLLDWIDSEFCEIVCEGYEGFPTNIFKKIKVTFFSSKYKNLNQKIHMNFHEDEIKYFSKKLSTSEFSELANFSSKFNLEKWKAWREAIDSEKDLNNQLSELKRFQKEADMLIQLNSHFETYRRADKQLKDRFTAGDWVEHQRLEHIAQNREVFELSIEFLYQENLKHKKKVILVVDHWKSLVSNSNLGDKFNRYLNDLDDYYYHLSLAYPVMVSTLASIPKVAGYQKLEYLKAYKPFDYCLIDEAGMISVESMLPSLSRCNEAIVVGDPLQLEPIRTISEHSANLIANKHFPDNHREHERISANSVTAYHRAAGAVNGDYSEVGDGIVLDEHRRCHESIAQLFVEIAGYSKLKIKSHELAVGHRLNTAFDKMGGFRKMFYSVQGQQGNEPNTNIAEVESIERVLDKLQSSGYDLTKDVGVITPYKYQRKTLIKKLKDRLNHTHEFPKIGTIHQFQGVDFEVIIYSPVIYLPAHKTGFQNNTPNMLNVAVSRAKQQFIIVGNYRKLISAGGYLKLLAEQCGEEFLLELEKQSKSYNRLKQTGQNIKSVFNCEHNSIFNEELIRAKESVKIIVPWIRSYKGHHPQLELLKQIQKKGIEIKIFYGYNHINSKNRDDGDTELINQYAEVFKANMIRLVEGTHEKILIVDDKWAVVGSWNWLSHNYHNYCEKDTLDSFQIRKETSLVTSNNAVIDELIENL